MRGTSETSGCVARTWGSIQLRSHELCSERQLDDVEAENADPMTLQCREAVRMRAMYAV